MWVCGLKRRNDLSLKPKLLIAVNLIAMKRLLFISGMTISILVIACNGKPGTTDNASSGSATSGGGSGHIDSLKAIGTGVNGESSNTLDTKDTLTNGHSVASPADSAKKKKP
jgi:hypothetical protein